MTVDEPSLLGRGAELRELRSLLVDTAARRGRIALVTGDAGIGKTCLVEALAAEARRSGFAVAWGRCSASDLPPYWPWVQVLTELTGAGALLSTGRFASRPEQLAAVAEDIAARSRANPVLVLLEDLHWADPGSLALLEFMTSLVSGQRLCVVATSREDDDTLPTGGGVRRLALSGLDQTDTGALVRRISGAVPDDYVRKVHRRTAGNPFFASEVARLQVSRRSTDTSVPVGVRQVLEHRLARLPQESFELLQLASVIGTPHVNSLTRVSGRTAEEVRALLVPARVARIVDGDGFVHDLMRETLYLGLSPSRRAQLHRRAAERLQGEGPAELARHWSLAPGPDARRRAAGLAEMAGDVAAGGLAYEQAAEHYRTALELGPGGLGLRRRLGESLVLGGRIEAGRDVLRGVAVDARAAGAGEELARAVLAMGGGMGGFEVDVFDPDLSPFVDDALRLLPEGDSALRAALLARKSLVHTGAVDDDERAALAREAVATARRVGDPAAEASALAALCDVRSGPDHVEERLEAAQRMLTLARDHAVLQLLARRIRLRARLEIGDLTGAQADADAYARVSDRLRSPTYSWLVPLWRGMFAALGDDLTTAEQHADEVAALAERAQSTNADMMAWSLRWWIARRRHDVDAIRELTSKLLQWSDDYVAWEGSFALLFAEGGDDERARLHVRRVVRTGIGALPKDSEWVEILWLLGDAALLLDEREAVAMVRDALAPYADLWAVDGYGSACFGQVSELLARLDTYLGDAVRADAAVFARSGSLWRLEFRGRAATVVDAKGLRDLATLLARPGREVHVLDLVEATGGPSRAGAGSDTGPVLDARARDAYRQRLADLEDDLDEASLDHDRGRVEKLQGEKAFLVAELTSALGLGGRSRVSGDPVDRARKAVTMRIGTALKAIDAVHPELARHLRNSISTGRSCVYRPEAEVTWET